MAMLTQNTSNLSTLSLQLSSKWTTMPLVTLITALLTILFNTFLLTVYASDRRLRTPFGILVMNLFIANLIYTILQSPLDLYLYVTKPGHTQAFCVTYLYITYVFPPILPLCHLAITVNRVWAVSWPISYRKTHSQTVALGVSVSLYIVCNLFYLPGILVDALVYRNDNDNKNCAMNSTPSPQTPWKVLTTYIFYVVPLVVMVLCYPYFGYRRWRRMQKIRNNGESIGTSSKSGEIVTKTKRSSHSFWILTLLIGSMVVCWTPMIVFFTLREYVGSALFYQVGKIMKLCQTVVDPLLFAVSMRDVQLACIRLLKRNG